VQVGVIVGKTKLISGSCNAQQVW